MSKNRAWVTYGTDYRQMAYDVLQAAGVAGRIPGKDARVALKPNLVVAAPASNGATTHPELAAGAIEYLRAHGFHHVVIAEGAWVGERTGRAFDACGYTAMAKRYGVTLLDTQRDHSRSFECAGMPLNICGCVGGFDYLINMPVLKGHCQTALTCALKNLKGLIPDSEKRRFHTMGLMRPIAHLSAGIRQDFVLVDAICGDLDFEEGGNPVRRDQVLGFLDPVLCDAYACGMLGHSVAEVPYIGAAEALGVGSADVSSIQLTELSRPGAGLDPRPTRRVQALARHIDASDACSACYGGLIHALHRLGEDGWLNRNGLPGKACIGQGFKGQAGPPGALGIGTCTAAFARAVPGCPPTAARMLEALKDWAGHR
ncbi:MAG: DUF362 domain-containing protein [Clostridia bacterium]|nr:DUF362 domain-containing protein [Clostridia bacterium]